MSEPDITTDPEAWLAEQATSPPRDRTQDMLRTLFASGRPDDLPSRRTPNDHPLRGSITYPHGALRYRDPDDPLDDQVDTSLIPDRYDQFRVSHHAAPPAGAVDLIAKTANPNFLQTTLNQLPRVIAEVLTRDWNETDQEALIRCYNGCEGFVQYACTNQGYAQIVGILR